MTTTRNPYGPLQRTDLKKFEESLRPLRLPDEFREFLIQCNGAHFDECPEFDDVPGGTALEDIFGLHTGPEYLRLDHAWLTYQKLVSSPFLVFASDPFGNYFAMSLHHEDRGSVHFVDHEHFPGNGGKLTKVANTFDDLLQRADFNLGLPPERASLVDAIQAGDQDAVRVFLRNGASARGHVHAAVLRGDLVLLEMLLDAGGNPDERGGLDGTETPLFVAARGGRADLAALLIKRGANVNLRCAQGGTALEMAAPWAKVVVVLARAGAEPTTPRLRALLARIRGAN